MTKLIKIQKVKKVFKLGEYQTTALRDISFEVDKGEFVVVFGPSGAGKSTLLNIVLGLECPTDGKVFLGDKKVCDLPDEERTHIRRNKFGVIYQQSNWIKSLNVIENVAFPLLVRGSRHKEAIAIATKKLELVNMYRFAKQNPMQLSGGQQQKVCLARALVTDPDIIVGDEPTGNLDTSSGDDLMNIFKALSFYHGKTVIVVTHNPLYKKYADKVLTIENGLSSIHKKTGRKAIEEARKGNDLLNMKFNPNEVNL